jgi:hypothetical protein
MDDLDLKNPEVLKKKLNLDTARISWELLANYQKEEAVIEVDTGLDLIEVATDFALDNSQRVKAWLEAKQIRKVDDLQASKWLQQGQDVWAVVVAPWVLVQAEKPQNP